MRIGGCGFDKDVRSREQGRIQSRASQDDEREYWDLIERTPSQLLAVQGRVGSGETCEAACQAWKIDLKSWHESGYILEEDGVSGSMGIVGKSIEKWPE